MASQYCTKCLQRFRHIKPESVNNERILQECQVFSPPCCSLSALNNSVPVPTLSPSSAILLLMTKQPNHLWARSMAALFSSTLIEIPHLKDLTLPSPLTTGRPGAKIFLSSTFTSSWWTGKLKARKRIAYLHGRQRWVCGSLWSLDGFDLEISDALVPAFLSSLIMCWRVNYQSTIEFTDAAGCRYTVLSWKCVSQNTNIFPLFIFSCSWNRFFINGCWKSWNRMTWIHRFQLILGHECRICYLDSCCYRIWNWV